MQNKKLSIITICYNEPNLEKTCESIVNQTWQDFEWIVVDGGSNSETLKIFEKYKYRIDKFVSEKDNGVYNAMNKGIKIATGEYLNFMNAGDSYDDNEVLSDVFSSNKFNGKILYGNEYYANYCNMKKYLRKMPEKLTKEHFILTTIRHQSSFINRNLFDKYGLYNEEYKIVSDWEKWIDFFIHGERFQYIPRVIALYDTKGCSFNQTDEIMKLHRLERAKVLEQYFSKSELDAVFKRDKTKYTIFEQIFSVKNANDKRHKIITILGIHIKIKRKRS